MSNRLWFKFAKGGKMKYIGHLDLLKIIQAAIRRAALPIAYSQGFNPHQRLSFALPLPLGMDSVAEYLELQLNDEANEAFYNPTQVQTALNAQLPDGLSMLEGWNIPSPTSTPSPAAAVSAADYRLNLPNANIESILQAKQLLVMKKSKSGIKETDIRPDILSMEREITGSILVRLSAGSARNLSPLSLPFDDFAQSKVTRLSLLSSKNGKLVPLQEITQP